MHEPEAQRLQKMQVVQKGILGWNYTMEMYLLNIRFEKVGDALFIQTDAPL